MKCQDVRRFLGPFLDDELDARTSYELGLHLNGCAACRERVEGERRLEAELASAVRDDDTTPEMWDRALARIAPRRRRWPPWTAAAVLLAGLAALWGVPRRPDLVQLALADHRELVEGRFGPDVPTSDAVAAARYVRESTSIDASLPTPSEGCGVVGSRLCYLRGAAVGLVIYKLRGEPVSIFLVPTEELERFADLHAGSVHEGDLVAVCRVVPGAGCAIVSVGPQSHERDVARLAREVASR